MKSDSTPTLYDVATRAQVSPATVSRFLNNPDAVRQNRRDRIEAAIKDLGYVPHGAARALASRRTRMIGALFPSLDSVLFGHFIAPLQRHLRDEGYTLVVSSSDYDKDTEYQQLRSLVSNGVDGIMLVGTQHAQPCFDLLSHKPIPVVLTWTWDDACDYPQVGFCNATAAGSMARYLCDIGHRRIAMISGETEGNDRAAERVRGVREALAERGLDLPPEYLAEVPFGLREGADAFRGLLGQATPPTAVLCGSDLFAYGALFEARRMGLNVPRDVSITGFDDTDLAASVFPSLTTVRTPRTEMAALTADFLLATLDGRPTTSHKLQTELIIRESTAPPPR